MYFIKEQLKFCGLPETLHLISTFQKERAFGKKSTLHEPSQIAYSKETEGARVQFHLLFIVLVETLSFAAQAKGY